MAHQNCALLAADSRGGLCPCSSGCWGAVLGWQSQGGWHRSSQPWDMWLSLVAAETGVHVQQRERSHSEIACIFLNSFVEWCLPFILPPGLCMHCWHSLPILYNNSQVSTSHCLPMEPAVTGPPAWSHEKLHGKV